MNYKKFEELLEQAKINKKEFADMVDMNYVSITNWNKSQKIPNWVESWLKNYIKAKDMDKVVEAVKPHIK
jgi:DNA-binding transcriptional regulator YiaG